MLQLLGRRKIIIAVVALVAMMVFAYALTGPSRTVSALALALENNDESSLDACIDMERFRASVHQLVTGEKSGELDATTEFLIDSMLVPGFVAKLGWSLKSDSNLRKYESLNAYSIFVADDETGGHRYTFEPCGLQWKLCTISEWKSPNPKQFEEIAE